MPQSQAGCGAGCGVRLTTIEQRMCLSSEWLRSIHWQQRPLFVGMLVEEAEMKVCLPRCVCNLQEGEVRRTCEMCSTREDGNTAALGGMLGARHRKCVAPQAHHTLARAFLLLCSVFQCLWEVEWLYRDQSMLSGEGNTAQL